jgi:hypothetical protein
MAKDLDFGLPFFYRVVLPGLLLGAAANPLVGPYMQLLGVEGLDAPVWLALVGAVVVGVLLSALDDPIYQFYEGRMGWPRWLARWRTKKWRAHVASLQHHARAAKQRGDMPTYDEIWSQLRQFPEDAEGEPTATAPTRMGNILAAYEDYPRRRYGMDSVFYWYRLWLRVDKDVREEIDRTWASTDALMYLAFGSAVLGVVYWISLAVSLVTAALGSPTLATAEQPRYLVGGAALLLISYVPYRLSIPGHLVNGELYKSLFDVFRSVLKKDLATPSASERDEWNALWAGLQYGVKLPKAHQNSALERIIASIRRWGEPR